MKWISGLLRMACRVDYAVTVATVLCSVLAEFMGLGTQSEMLMYTLTGEIDVSVH